MGYYLSLSNVLSTYAGFMSDKTELLKVSSGGIATILSYNIIDRGGVVYGATYSTDFYSAHYFRAKDRFDLAGLKGSKYCYVKKLIEKNGEWISVFDAVCDDLNDEKEVMFVGLGCDVAALKRYCLKKNISQDKLLIVELLCDGVTYEIVHNEYIKYIETLHRSKLVDFTVRCKRDGWVPIYICAKFQNGDEHIVPFYETPYGFCFAHYKKQVCYSCEFRGKNHYGDLIIGDYRGCEPGMPEYNKDGVSIIYVLTDKGEDYIQNITYSDFKIIETDSEFALRHTPSFFFPHQKNINWNRVKEVIKEKGIFGVMPDYYGLKDNEYPMIIKQKEIVMYGAGSCFHRLAPYVLEYINISCVVDKNSEKWNRITECGIVCRNPDYIRNKNVFVIIMTEDAAITCQIINTLLKMNVRYFENVFNLIRGEFFTIGQNSQNFEYVGENK